MKVFSGKPKGVSLGKAVCWCEKEKDTFIPKTNFYNTGVEYNSIGEAFESLRKLMDEVESKVGYINFKAEDGSYMEVAKVHRLHKQEPLKFNGLLPWNWFKTDKK